LNASPYARNREPTGSSTVANIVKNDDAELPGALIRIAIVETVSKRVLGRYLHTRESS
jgi:hypothetical protein